MQVPPRISNHRLPAIGFLLIAVLLASCSKKEQATQPIVPPAPTPNFVASPDTLYLADASPDTAVRVSTDIAGALVWRVTSKPVWITVDPESGQATQTSQEVVISASTAGLGAGIHPGVIVFGSSSGSRNVVVWFSVAQHPNAAASVTSLHFPPAAHDDAFTLTNHGTGLLTWSVASSQAWLNLVPTSGALLEGRSTTIYAKTNRRGLPPGIAEATVTIASNSEGGAIEIPVVLDPAPILQSAPPLLAFDYFVDTRSFKLWNAGNAPLSWSAAGTEAYLQLAPVAGQLGPGDTATVRVTVDRSGLANGIHTAGIEVTSNDGLGPRHLDLLVPHFRDTKWMFGTPVIDAEYDRVHDRIVAVGDDGTPRLMVIDPESRTMQSVALALPASCVSVHPNGLYAVVGHDTSVSYVDLGALMVQRTYSVGIKVSDVVLAGNGWVYVLPKGPRLEIRCIELSTGDQIPVSGGSPYYGTIGKRHPSGDYLYTTFDGYCLDKYDIRSGPAEYLYSTPTSIALNYPVGFDFWISQDGLRIFGQNVFQSSSVPAEDLLAKARIELGRWVEPCARAGLFFINPPDPLYGEALPELRVYSMSSFNLLGIVPLEPYVIPNGSGGATFVSSQGRFTFANAAETRVHVLLRATPKAGLQNEWAIQSFDMKSMP